MQNRITTCNEYVNLQNDIQLIVNIMQRHETAITMNVNYTLKIYVTILMKTGTNITPSFQETGKDWKTVFPLFNLKKAHLRRGKPLYKTIMNNPKVTLPLITVPRPKRSGPSNRPLVLRLIGDN